MTLACPGLRGDTRMLSVLMASVPQSSVSPDDSVTLSDAVKVIMRSGMGKNRNDIFLIDETVSSHVSAGMVVVVVGCTEVVVVVGGTEVVVVVGCTEEVVVIGSTVVVVGSCVVVVVGKIVVVLPLPNNVNDRL